MNDKQKWLARQIGQTHSSESSDEGMDEENVELLPGLEKQDDSSSDESKTESKDEKLINQLERKRIAR